MGNDTELLESWRSGNQRAGEYLLIRYFDNLYRFFASKLDDDIESLIQHTLMACVEQDHDLADSCESFRGYLFKVARQELYAHLRGLNHERVFSRITAQHLRDLTDSANTLMVERQEQKLLLKSLRQLQMDQQIVLGLFYWEGLQMKELAQVLNMPPNVIEPHLQRAREELVGYMRQLASSPELRRNTVENLDAWFSSLDLRR